MLDPRQRCWFGGAEESAWGSSTVHGAENAPGHTLGMENVWEGGWDPAGAGTTLWALTLCVDRSQSTKHCLFPLEPVLFACT